MRALFWSALSLAVAWESCAIAEAQNAAGKTAPFEIVKSHSDFDVNADGSYTEASELAYRLLDASGRETLQQTTLSYTDGLQSIDVVHAYTLKANGEKIDVPADQIMRGFGATSEPGFQDLRTLTIVFPKLDIGDQVVLVTLFRQKTPLFAGQFAASEMFSRAIKTDDVQITITAPESGFPLKLDMSGLGGGERQSFAGKYRWAWTFSNDVPTAFEPDSVVDIGRLPHLIVSSFPSYPVVASAYAAHFDKKDDVTPEIQSLADDLTKGVSDRREQARILYDWVSRNISYVDIVLGAGGFTPHAASEVLSNRFGDCKDHVMLLAALLKAKGIASMPALISVGSTYTLSDVASPFYFNHLITYVPELHLYLDSTARYAAFGVLPFTDADKPVLLVPSGELAYTPAVSADMARNATTATSVIAADGTVEGDMHNSEWGPMAVLARALMENIPADREDELLRRMLGPGAEGKLNRHDPTNLSDPYLYDLHFRIPGAVTLPGPGAVPISADIRALAGAIAGTLPASRNSDYLCMSLSNTISETITFPKGTTFISLPKGVDVQTDRIHLKTDYEIQDGTTIHETASLRMDHPKAICTPDYYAKVRPDLARMVTALRAQILYK